MITHHKYFCQECGEKFRYKVTLKKHDCPEKLPRKPHKPVKEFWLDSDREKPRYFGKKRKKRTSSKTVRYNEQHNQLKGGAT